MADRMVTRGLTADEVRRLLGASPQPWRFLWRVLLATGMRAAEMVAWHPEPLPGTEDGPLTVPRLQRAFRLCCRKAGITTRPLVTERAVYRVNLFSLRRTARAA